MSDQEKVRLEAFEKMLAGIQKIIRTLPKKWRLSKKRIKQKQPPTGSCLQTGCDIRRCFLCTGPMGLWNKSSSYWTTWNR